MRWCHCQPVALRNRLAQQTGAADWRNRLAWLYQPAILAMAAARIGTVRVFSPAMLMRLSLTM